DHPRLIGNVGVSHVDGQRGALVNQSHLTLNRQMAKGATDDGCCVSIPLSHLSLKYLRSKKISRRAGFRIAQRGGFLPAKQRSSFAHAWCYKIVACAFIG